MLDFFEYAFMGRAFLAAIIIGLTCSLVGVFVVLRSLSFIGAGIAHAAFAGVALAFLIGVNPHALGIAFALAMVWLVGLISRKSELKLDAAIGILFAQTLALAVLFIGLMQQYNVELFGYLFGNLLGVRPSDLWIVGGVSGLVLLILWLFFKEFQFISFDSDMAEASGLPAQALFYLLLILIALTIVISLQAVGELLVIALLVIPAATAMQLTHSLKGMLTLAGVIGTSTSVLGLFFSFAFDLPTGASIVILLGVTFAIATTFSPKKRCKLVNPAE